MAARDITARLKFHKDLLMRSAGFAAAAITVCGALAVGSILRDPARLSPPAAEAAAEDAKDQSRVARGARPSGSEAIADVADRRAPASQDGEAAAKTETVESGWQEQEFTVFSVVDGRTLRTGSFTIALSGLELPPPDQVCRTLDNRLEQCATRAATQLELLTRSRTLACRYRMTTSGEAAGSCRIGAHDLAERMIRTGYVRADRAVLATAAGIEPSR